MLQSSWDSKDQGAQVQMGDDPLQQDPWGWSPGLGDKGPGSLPHVGGSGSQHHLENLILPPAQKRVA